MVEYKRGEKVSAHEFVKISALKKLLILLEKHLVNENNNLLDNIDPLRRFEFVYSDLGKEMESILLKPIPEAAGALLNILRRELSGQLSLEYKKAIEIIISKYL
ncbi:MAG: hypothetical protein FH762_08405 [Firmicutes bacterium]|nr:hypothetical protein [Bacillota bacterium]